MQIDIVETFRLVQNSNQNAIDCRHWPAQGAREGERRAVLQLSLTRVARRGAPPFLGSFGLHCAFTRQAHRGGTRRRAPVFVVVVAIIILVDAAIESVSAAALIRRQALSDQRKAKSRTTESSRDPTATDPTTSRSYETSSSSLERIKVKGGPTGMKMRDRQTRVPPIEHSHSI
ncbi:hypothetical protein X777_00362 [Ooceraea biroi]|uniref:Uncharacterized protein n=1 Tax=Ooceraea biroi TaxID=2015173 RepID=A0A026WWL4_OOCBI|nr:hypothetical protein X777_00362 [Ooceraea biroi]